MDGGMIMVTIKLSAFYARSGIHTIGNVVSPYERFTSLCKQSSSTEGMQKSSWVHESVVQTAWKGFVLSAEVKVKHERVSVCVASVLTSGSFLAWCFLPAEDYNENTINKKLGSRTRRCQLDASAQT